MSPTEKYEEAAAVLKQHEKEHYPLRDRYEDSLQRLRNLTQKAADAWDEAGRP